MEDRRTVCRPFLYMRQFPDVASKIVSQAVFGEEVEVLASDKEKICIRTADGYQGWIDCDKGLACGKYDRSIQTCRLVAHVYEVMDTAYGPLLSLPFQSPLKILEQCNKRWLRIALPKGKEGYIQSGDVTNLFDPLPMKEIPLFARKFLGLPYTWGGRSSFGYDCSGFVQMLYRQSGTALPRDSKDQIQDKRFETVAIGDVQGGDLLFFGSEKQEISHVGLILDKESFIHATVGENMPWIRISLLSDFAWSGLPSNFYSHRVARRLRTINALQ